MKKGCFVKSIVILTIFVAVITYIIQYKFEDWISKPGRKLLIPLVEKSFQKEFDYIKDSPEKDSLLIYISKYVENMNLRNDKDSAKIKFWEKVNMIAADSIVVQTEIEELKNFLEM